MLAWDDDESSRTVCRLEDMAERLGESAAIIERARFESTREAALVPRATSTTTSRTTRLCTPTLGLSRLLSVTLVTHDFPGEPSASAEKESISGAGGISTREVATGKKT